MCQRVKNSVATQFIRQLLYRQFIVILALWLAIFAPAMCDQHGLLYRFGPGSQVPMPGMAMSSMAGCPDGANMSDQKNMAACSDDRALPVRNSANGMYGHSTPSTTTMVLSLLILVVPDRLALQQINPRASSIRSDMDFPEQRRVAPPDRPPIML